MKTFKEESIESSLYFYSIEWSKHLYWKRCAIDFISLIDRY